ncbi:MAG: lmo0937 family membrane protein [Candidatus Falkowbacteria bacterium]|nr:lmo0937 family membrane protein [Candidatus Falkowbacteria bacterium]
MLLTIGLILIVLWLIGFIAFPVLGWFIHILLVIAIIMILLRFIRGK